MYMLFYVKILYKKKLREMSRAHVYIFPGYLSFMNRDHMEKMKIILLFFLLVLMYVILVLFVVKFSVSEETLVEILRIE